MVLMTNSTKMASFVREFKSSETTSSLEKLRQLINLSLTQMYQTFSNKQNHTRTGQRHLSIQKKATLIKL
jgi:hypothetical protein